MFSPAKRRSPDSKENAEQESSKQRKTDGHSLGRSPDSKENAEQESSKQRKTDGHSLGFNPDDPFSVSDDEFDGKQQEQRMVQMGQKGANLDKDMKQDIITEKKDRKRDIIIIVNGKRRIKKVDAVHELPLDDGWDDDTEMDFEYYTTWLDESDFHQDIKNRMMCWHEIALKSQGFQLDDGAPEGYGWAYVVKDEDEWKIVDKLAPYAIETYNKRFENEGKSLVLERVEYANAMRGTPMGVYFITLMTRDKSGNLKRFQTRVSYTANEERKLEIIEVPVFRPEVEKVS